MIRFSAGVVLGFLLAVIWYQRRQVKALVENREALGAAGTIWGGLQDIFTGGKDLYDEIRETN